MGIAHYREDTERFINARVKWLEFERDPRNMHDPNAIKVIGCAKGLFGIKRLMLGYVPRDIANAMANAGVVALIRPRLLKTYQGKGGFLEVLFQIVGPKKSFPEPPRPNAEAHYPEHVDRIKWLGSEGRSDDAIETLLKMVEQIEKESVAEGTGVAPWYYEQLAIQYRRKKLYDEELAILERYERQKKAPGVGPKKLSERLAKVRAGKAR